MRIGFVGLGNMGSGMARNLIRAGHEVLVFNRSREKAEQLAGEGARVADNASAAAATGTVVSMLADDGAVEDVVFGVNGIFAGLPQGGTHISMSTISRAMSERLSKAHTAASHDYIAAPVFGRPEAAASAKLIIVVAGLSQTIERCRPLLEAMGRKLAVVGREPWMANVFKLTGNFTIASMIETLGEANAILRKSGVDPKIFLDIIGGELFRSPVYENYGRIILEEKFEPAGFRLKLGLKDTRLVLAAADAAEAPMPIANVLHDAFLAMTARGDGEIDWAGVSRLASERAGLTNGKK
jgi:3-hydroxyisobutyrate dehydrogenase-like beta-hydroxyacid dehydrogenase